MVKEITETLPPVNSEEVADVELKLASRERILVAGIWLDLTDLPDGSPPFQIKSGKISIDKKRFLEEKEKVEKALEASIRTGDEHTFNKMTGGLKFAEDEEQVDAYIKLRKLFDLGKSSKLKSINVDFLTDGIAQRNIMREGLKPQVEKLPFTFMDRNGKALDHEKDLDLVFVKDKDGGYKLIVASKKGIDEIVVPEAFNADQFQPDFLKIDKDVVTDTITIPLKPSRDGSESYVVSVEIRKGPIDLPHKLAIEEAQEIAKRARKKREENYNPPPVRTPRRSSESGGYGYTSVSS